MAVEVNREGLDYRAGYVEALIAFSQQLSILSVRAKKGEIAGLAAAIGIAKALHAAMLDKMRGKPATPAAADDEGDAD